jgi:outer membrane protein TolC
MKIKNISLYVCFAVATTASAQTLTLSVAECRERALNTSEDIQTARIESEQAVLDLDIAKRAALPTIDGSAMLEYMVPDITMGSIEMQMRGAYVAGLNLIQPIYTGGKITAGKRLANIGTQVSQEKEKLSRMDVISNADNAYWTMVAVDGKIEMLNAYMQQMDSLYAQVGHSVNIGMATKNDLLRIETRRSDIQYNLKKAKNGREMCRLSLCRIIGVDSSTPIVLTDTNISVTEPGLLSNDISDRPELALLNLAIKANEQQVKMAKADYLPTIGLALGYFRYGNIKTVTSYQLENGSIGKYSTNTNDGIGMALLSVKIPIFNWGTTGKKVKKAKLDLQKSEVALSKNSRLLSLETQQAITNVNDGYDLVKSARIALNQAEENLQSIQARYKVALCQMIDLLDAQSQWQQAKSNLLEASAQYKIYQTEYLRTVGKL